MNITPIIAAYGSQAGEAVSSKGKPGKAEVKPQSVQSASVSISDASREAQMVRDAIAKMPEVRIKVVEEIKARIQKNDYPIENRLLKAFDNLVSAGILG